jgi:hypothetical protein
LTLWTTDQLVKHLDEIRAAGEFVLARADAAIDASPPREHSEESFVIHDACHCKTLRDRKNRVTWRDCDDPR